MKPPDAGQNGYPAILDIDLADRARAQLTRTDPAARQRRKGGRPPKTPSILRGIAFCTCGAPLYALAARRERPRRYVCRNAIQANGLCHRPAIPGSDG